MDGGKCLCGQRNPLEMDMWHQQPESHCNRNCGDDSKAKCGRRMEQPGVSDNSANVYKDPCKSYPTQTKVILDPDDPTCKKFLTCSDGNYQSSGSCLSGKVYDLTVGSCVPKNRGQCYNAKLKTYAMVKESHDYIGCFRHNTNNELYANAWIGNDNSPQK